MRLAPFFTALHPVKEILEAEAAGEEVLEAEIAHRSKQVLVGTADKGLDLWESDYGLPHGVDLTLRRAAIRAALSSDRTLTRAYLQELAVTVGGGDEGRVTEDYPHWRAEVEVVSHDRAPVRTRALEKAVERLKPAHLQVDVRPSAEIHGRQTRYSALTAGVFLQLSGR